MMTAVELSAIFLARTGTKDFLTPVAQPTGCHAGARSQHDGDARLGIGSAAGVLGAMGASAGAAALNPAARRRRRRERPRDAGAGS